MILLFAARHGDGLHKGAACLDRPAVRYQFFPGVKLQVQHLPDGIYQWHDLTASADPHICKHTVGIAEPIEIQGSHQLYGNVLVCFETLVTLQAVFKICQEVGMCQVDIDPVDIGQYIVKR